MFKIIRKKTWATTVRRLQNQTVHIRSLVQTLENQRRRIEALSQECFALRQKVGELNGTRDPKPVLPSEQYMAKCPRCQEVEFQFSIPERCPKCNQKLCKPTEADVLKQMEARANEIYTKFGSGVEIVGGGVQSGQ
jgi:ribosomal protein S27E